MMRLVLALLAMTATAASVMAAEPVERMDLHAYERRAASIFNPSFVTNPGSELNNACERVLLVFQAISVVGIVGGMIMRMRRDQEQMEGVASMMLKVAFIATIPFWRSFVLETADSIADAVGYRAVSYSDASSPLMARMWDMAGRWIPESTPQLDALEAQRSDNIPASGEEQSWSMRAWNWARGVAASTSSMFNWLWQTFTGGIRSLFILLCCAVVACVVLVLIVLMYFGEVLRYFLFHVGCALLPVFIAGLGLDMLRQQSINYILGLAAVACWPIGWALANIGTTVMIEGVTTWMANLTAVALGLAAGSAVLPPLATAAPYLAWGVLFLFAALTIGICIWSLVALVLAPVAMGKMVATGAQFMGGMLGAATSGTLNGGAKAGGAVAIAMSGGTASPAAAGMSAAAAAASRLAGGAVGAFARAATGITRTAGRAGGPRVAGAVANIGGRLAATGANMAAGMSAAATTTATAMSTSLGGRGGRALVGGLRVVAEAAAAGARIDGRNENQAGREIGGMAGSAATAAASKWLPQPKNLSPGRKRTANNRY